MNGRVLPARTGRRHKLTLTITMSSRRVLYNGWRVKDPTVFPSCWKRWSSLAVAVSLALVVFNPPASVAQAEPAAPATTALRDTLFRQSLKRPRDVPLALAYVKACVELHDYEGAIGALERLQFFAPEDAQIKAELGFLYHQLHTHEMARQDFDAALTGAGLDETTRAKIAAVGRDVDKAVTGRSVFGSLQVGARYQTNAAFNPDNDILRISNQDHLLTNPKDRGSDGNTFTVAQIGYDYDLGNQRGDTVEARFTGYATQQFHFTDLNVGLYDISVGPRLALAPDALPGWTIKPYATGGQVFLAGSRYLASGGFGVLADLPVRAGLLLEPGAEVRHVQFSNVSIFSSLNTGDTATASLAGQAAINDAFSLSGRLYYTRDDAAAAYQSSNSYAEELALVARFAAPLPGVKVPWSASPYVKLLQVTFDDANPFIDAATKRRDEEVQAGFVLDTSINAAISVLTNVQYARIASNIPNYRLRNFSVLTGPTVRF